MVQTAEQAPDQSTDSDQRAAYVDDLRDLPPSAKLVAKALELDGPATQGELLEETLLPRRTVSFALNRLDEADIIEKRPTLRDPRKTLYSLA